MDQRKVFCEVVCGVVYEDRCLYRLCKVIDENRACELCVVREIEKLRKNQVEKPKTTSVRIRKANKEERENINPQ